MKRVEAVIRPERLEDVKRALSEVDTHGITVYEARGHGVQGGVIPSWSEGETSIDLLPKTVVSLIVHDHEVATVTEAIVRISRTGIPGDGKVFVSPVDDVMRVRTGESGPAAL